MLTITLPEKGFERSYETSRLRDCLAGGKVCGTLRKTWNRDVNNFTGPVDYPQQRRLRALRGGSKQVDRTWADDDTEVILSSGRPPQKTGLASQGRFGEYWLSPRTVESGGYLLDITVFGGESGLYLEVTSFGNGDPGAVRLDNVVVGAPPVIVPTNYCLTLRLDPGVEAPEIRVCPDCGCFHPRPADCPGPAVK